MSTVNVDGIEVGTPATYSPYSDQNPGIVIKVTPKTVTIQAVAHGNNRAVWPEQDFEVFFDRPVGKPIVFRKTKQGYRSANGLRVGFGVARYYRDPHF